MGSQRANSKMPKSFTRNMAALLVFASTLLKVQIWSLGIIQCREVAASDLSIDKLLKVVEDAGSLSLSDERISITFLSSLSNPSRLPSGDS